MGGYPLRLTLEEGKRGRNEFRTLEDDRNLAKIHNVWHPHADSGNWVILGRLAYVPPYVGRTLDVECQGRMEG